MAYDFPANPVQDQEFTPAGGPTYVFKAPRWLIKDGGSSGGDGGTDLVDWAEISNKPATFPPTLPISQADVTNLTTDLAAKVKDTGDTITGPIKISVADAALGLLVNGTTKGVRLLGSPGYFAIEGVDHTGVGSYQPLRLFGSQIDLGVRTVVTASTATKASFQLVPGVAPTVPFDGDMWTTANGYFVRINAVTYQMATKDDITGLTTSLAGKADLAGATFTGKVTVPPSVSGESAGFNLPPGNSPTAVVGDVWMVGNSIRWRGTSVGSVEAATLGTAQTFSAAKTFSSNATFQATVTFAAGGTIVFSTTTTITGKPVFSTPTTAQASINLPHGVAPTAPIDGDAWTTTEGYFVRINAVTYQMATKDDIAGLVASTVPEAPVDGTQYARQDGAWTPVAAGGGGGASAGFRNRLVNPAFQISQENGITIGTVNGYHPVDQWRIDFATVTGRFEVNQRIATATYPTFLEIDCTVAQASVTDGYWAMSQAVEGQEMLNAACGAPQAVPMVARVVMLSDKLGTFSVCLRKADGTQSWVGEGTITTVNIRQEFEWAIPLNNVGGSWPWLNDKWGDFMVVLSAGTAQKGALGWNNTPGIVAGPNQTNFLDSASNDLVLYAAGLYVDKDGAGVAPPWDHPSGADEFLRCQRYYQKMSPLIVSGYAAAGALQFSSVPLAPRMRATPTVTYAAVAYSNMSGIALNGSTNSAIMTAATTTATGSGYTTFELIANARL